MGREDEIVELEHRYMGALRDRDMATLERLLGEDFTMTAGVPNREVRSRHDWLRIAEQEYDLRDFEFEELHVQHYGSCAVARSRFRQDASMGGGERNWTYRITDVWIKMPDGWKVQARHSQRVEAD